MELKFVGIANFGTGSARAHKVQPCLMELKFVSIANCGIRSALAHKVQPCLMELKFVSSCSLSSAMLDVAEVSIANFDTGSARAQVCQYCKFWNKISSCSLSSAMLDGAEVCQYCKFWNN